MQFVQQITVVHVSGDGLLIKKLLLLGRGAR